MPSWGGCIVQYILLKTTRLSELRRETTIVHTFACFYNLLLREALFSEVSVQWLKQFQKSSISVRVESESFKLLPESAVLYTYIFLNPAGQNITAKLKKGMFQVNLNLWWSNSAFRVHFTLFLVYLASRLIQSFKGVLVKRLSTWKNAINVNSE